MLGVAMEASSRLSAGGIEAEVVDLRTLKPLDMETVLGSVRKTSQALIIEECWQNCGIGAEVSSRICEGAFDSLDGPVRRLSAAEAPMPYNKELERAAVPDAEKAVRAVHEMLSR